MTTTLSTTINSDALPAATRTRAGGFWTGTVFVVGLTLLVAELDRAIANSFRAAGVAQNPIEYPLTAVAIGMIANFLLRWVRLHTYFRPAIRTEFYLKVGTVLLGARIMVGDLLATGAGGLVQAVVVVSMVFGFTWWLSGRLKLPNTLRAVMASAVSICGVTAAVAAAGSVKARKEEVTYTAGLVVLFSLPLMLLMPPLANALGVSAPVAGAWFGGNIDTTAAVVGAATLLSPKAQEVATVVKLSQNVLVGFAAFGLALLFATRFNQSEERPTARMIWTRFPKFVIGFALVSVFASTGLISRELAREIDTIGKWLFTLSFVCAGIEFSPREVWKAGWRPLGVYFAATIFNTVAALLMALLVFGLLFKG